MSEIYEGVVVVGDLNSIKAKFDSLESTRKLRLVGISDRLLGIQPDASRSDLFDEAEVTSFAMSLSAPSGLTLAVFYDNRIGLRTSKLFREGDLVRVFGEQDEHWVRLDDDGFPDLHSEALSIDQLEPNCEYECIKDAITLGLSELEIQHQVASSDLKRIFSYGEGEALAVRAAN